MPDKHSIYRRPIRIATAALAIVALWGCSPKQEASKPEGSQRSERPAKGNAGQREGGKDARPPQRPVAAAVPVTAASAIRGDISSTLEFDSVLETESAVDVFSESAGLILEVLVEEGDRVVEGQILARLENDEEVVAVDETIARYEQLRSIFRRTQDLYDRSLITQQEFEKGKFDLEQARLNSVKAEIRLDNTIIKAPVRGVITKRLAQKGSRVTSNRQLFAIMDLDELFASVSVPARYRLRIEQGLKAMVESEVIEGVSFPGIVKLVNPAIDPASGTFKVKIAVDTTSDAPIYPGMFVTTRIVVDTRSNAVLLPKASIVHEGDSKYVFVVRDSIARRLKIEEGYVTTSLVEAISGIREGDSVIIEGNKSLKDGARVRVVEEGLAGSSETVPAEPGDRS